MKKILYALILIISQSAFGQKEMYDICPIKISEELPDAIVFDTDGQELNLKNYINERPVVVVFYRGGWCPYCTRHLSALNEVHKQIDSLAYELIAITPDSFEHLDTTFARTDGIDFTLFSDKDINAINGFGIGWHINDELYSKYKNEYGIDTEWWSGSKHHVLPVPAVFVIEEGKIKHQYVNPDYSKRLSPKVLLSFLGSE